jgi:hypothetical protein
MNLSPSSSGRLLMPEAIHPNPHTFSWHCAQLNTGITLFLLHGRCQLHTSAASCPERGPVKNIRQEAGCVLESIYMTLREGKFLLQLGINL